jgi:hypothetical protein
VGKLLKILLTPDMMMIISTKPFLLIPQCLVYMGFFIRVLNAEILFFMLRVDK